MPRKRETHRRREQQRERERETSLDHGCKSKSRLDTKIHFVHVIDRYVVYIMASLVAKAQPVVVWFGGKPYGCPHVPGSGSGLWVDFLATVHSSVWWFFSHLQLYVGRLVWCTDVLLVGQTFD